MLHQQEVAFNPGPAGLGFVSKGRREYMIRRSSIHGGVLNAGPCVKWLFCLETLPIGSLSLRLSLQRPLSVPSVFIMDPSQRDEKFGEPRGHAYQERHLSITATHALDNWDTNLLRDCHCPTKNKGFC